MHTPTLGFLPQIIREICSGHKYSKNLIRGQGQGHSDSKMVYDTPLSNNTPTHQIWDSCLNNTRDMLRHDYSKNLGQRPGYSKTEEHPHPETQNSLFIPYFFFRKKSIYLIRTKFSPSSVHRFICSSIRPSRFL